jgi:hypothetical protein
MIQDFSKWQDLTAAVCGMSKSNVPKICEEEDRKRSECCSFNVTKEEHKRFKDRDK